MKTRPIRWYRTEGEYWNTYVLIQHTNGAWFGWSCMSPYGHSCSSKKAWENSYVKWTKSNKRHK